jgi:hypothetical protein
MKTVIVAMMIFVAYPALARQDQTPPAQPVTFFDVLDLPARLDEPKLQKNDTGYALKCALANRSGETLVGVRLTLVLLDVSNNNRITRVTWNEATSVSAYSIKTFEFHPPFKSEIKDATIFLGIDEAQSRETIWRTVDAEKLLRAYARGQSGLIPKVQKLQNKFDRNPIPVISRMEPRPKP